MPSTPMLAKLRAVEQQLRSALEGLQRYTIPQASDVPATPNGTETTLADTTAELETLVASVLRLQGELQAVTITVIAEAKQQAGVLPAVENTTMRSAVDSNASASGSDTETEDEMCGEGDARDDDSKHSTAMSSRDIRTNPVEKRKWRLLRNSERYLDAATKLTADEAGGKDAQRVQGVMTTAIKLTRRHATFLEETGAPYEQAAAIFVDAMLLLPAVLDTAVVKSVATRKWLTRLQNVFQSLLKQIDSTPGLSGAFKNPKLRTVYAKLQEHVVRSSSDSLGDVMKQVQNLNLAKVSWKKGRTRDALDRILHSFQRELRLIETNQRKGTAPPPTEGRWEMIEEASKGVAELIQRALQSPAAMQLRNAAKFERELRKFAKKFPNRIRPELRKASQQMQKLVFKKGKD